jgi:hypothetical protein
LPTLEEYRDATLKEEGGVLGVMEGFVSLDPDLADREAARSLISAKLYDDEKLSGAFGAQYVWIPHLSDQRRTLTRGYRVRYATIFQPPPDGSYRLQCYGYGQTRELPHTSPASAIETAIRAIDPAEGELIDVEVEPDPQGFLIHLPFRLGMGSTAGRMVAQGGVGICLVSRDFSVPLLKGMRYLLSPRIPFETEDELTGLHECINLALSDIDETDLLPVASPYPASQRRSIVRLSDIAPWLEADMVTGFFAPTTWASVTTFRPPASGTYVLQPHTARTWPTIATPLPYNATGQQIQDALRSVLATPSLHVQPAGVASVFEIIWESMYHEAHLDTTAGAITGYSSERTAAPYPIAVAPSFQSDFESDTFSDPGYGEDQSWFVECRRPADSKICPQTYPRRWDGSLDYTAQPCRGSLWIESVSGLVHDLDQARPSIEKVAPAALRYACMAIAAVAPAGEAQRWELMAAKMASVAASRVIYGKQIRRGYTTMRSWPPLDGSRGYWLP